MNTLRLALGSILALLTACSLGPLHRAPSTATAASTTIIADYAAGLESKDGDFQSKLTKARDDNATKPAATEMFDAVALFWSTMRAEAIRLQKSLPSDRAMFAVRDLREQQLLKLQNLLTEDRFEPCREAVWPLRDIESSVFDAAMQPTLKQDHVAVQARRADLLRRKYFADPEEQGNFVEALLNGHVGLFKSAPDGTKEDPGISPWEAVARIEPAVALDGTETPMLLGSLGVVHHFFPSYDPAKFDAGANETLWSSLLQRAGLRLSVGAAMPDNEAPDLVVGVGVQVRSLTAWATWDLENDDFFVSVGMNDLAFLGDLLPDFGGR